MIEVGKKLIMEKLVSDSDTASYYGVGIEVNVKHTRATPVGAKVYAEAELIAIEGKKLTFSVVAFDEEGEIGKGTHMRYIINPAKYMHKIS